MSKKRPHSPVSEDTLIGIVRDAGVNFQSSDTGSENGSNRDSSESEDSSSDYSFEDDTDEDPTFNPDQPSTSSSFRGNRPLMLSRPSVPLLTSESEEDEPPSRPSVVEQQDGRPRPTQTDVQQNDPADDSSSWVEVEEGNDPP
uniref:Uncharacterized protein n=1 Tax=Homalodisca liturata TaxID=320908 RepID=A0A1B6K1F8_9HEMI